MGLVEKAILWAAGKAGVTLPPSMGGDVSQNSETGRRATPEASLTYLYRQMWVDPDLRAAILDIRSMDREDGRVRRIHNRVARDTVKGGLVITQVSENDVLARKWSEFSRRLQLDRSEKLKSDARGLVMEGNLPLQIVIDANRNIVSAVRMPSETIMPQVDQDGRFKDVADAYWQIDPVRGQRLANFALWQLFLARFDPDNFDDQGSMGRPFLDAARTTWRKLCMTEEDLVIRRRTRAPLRHSHVLEGASVDELTAYRMSVEGGQGEITTDFYANKKGGVTALQGDSNLDQIADVVHLLDTFFGGGPLPKGLAGYTGGLARDILADLKGDYYDEIDLIQDTLANAYTAIFHLELLFDGINPDPEDITIKFAERRTETPTQTTDRMLKWQALAIPADMIYEEMGLNPQAVKARRNAAAKEGNPYPDPAGIAPQGSPRVSITPGNAPKGNSATDITLR